MILNLCNIYINILNLCNDIYKYNKVCVKRNKLF
jgi:hypothetical protein